MQRELYQQLGRSPTVAEIAAGLDVDEEQVLSLMVLRDPISLELQLSHDSESTGRLVSTIFKADRCSRCEWLCNRSTVSASNRSCNVMLTPMRWR